MPRRWKNLKTARNQLTQFLCSFGSVNCDIIYDENEWNRHSTMNKLYQLNGFLCTRTFQMLPYALSLCNEISLLSPLQTPTWLLLVLHMRCFTKPLYTFSLYCIAQATGSVWPNFQFKFFSLKCVINLEFGLTQSFDKMLVFEHLIQLVCIESLMNLTWMLCFKIDLFFV